MTALRGIHQYRNVFHYIIDVYIYMGNLLAQPVLLQQTSEGTVSLVIRGHGTVQYGMVWFVFMYVCMYGLCVCVYVYKYVYICMYACMHVCAR